MVQNRPNFPPATVCSIKRVLPGCSGLCGYVLEQQERGLTCTFANIWFRCRKLYEAERNTSNTVVNTNQNNEYQTLDIHHCTSVQTPEKPSSVQGSMVSEGCFLEPVPFHTSEDDVGRVIQCDCPKYELVQVKSVYQNSLVCPERHQPKVKQQRHSD